MLFPLKYIIMLALFSFSAVCIQAKTKSAFVSQEQKKEVQSIIEQAKQQSESHKADALNKATETKAIVQNIIEQEKMNFNTSPCLSKLGAQQNSCQVVKPESIDLLPKTSSVNTPTTLIVFISFSMPEESLKALFKEAENNAHVRLVLRGFIDDSMEKTARSIHDLKGVVDIDPELFERYQIERAPTFLWVKKGQPLGKLTGNITIAYAQEIVDEKIKTESHPS